MDKIYIGTEKYNHPFIYDIITFGCIANLFHLLLVYKIHRDKDQDLVIFYFQHLASVGHTKSTHYIV